ncbi:MAG: hypothetical protein R2769_02990 [Saprospiraceae bacterium]
MEIPYPEYGAADTVDEAIQIANRVEYPVWFVLLMYWADKACDIVINDEELERQVLSIYKHLPDNRVLI